MARTRSVNGNIVELSEDEATAFALEQEALTQEIAARDLADARQQKIEAKAKENAHKQAEQELIDDGTIESIAR